MTKRILSTLLAAALIFCLTACGRSSSVRKPGNTYERAAVFTEAVPTEAAGASHVGFRAEMTLR